MKNKKIALIATLILSITLLCTLLLGCDAKLKKTGGTTDGSAITADTDPSIIVSQKVNEEQWASAMNAYENYQVVFGKENPEKIAPLDSYSAKSTSRLQGDIIAEIELKYSKNTAYIKMDGIETYMEYDETSDTYYQYTANTAGVFSKTVVSQSAIDQSNKVMAQFLAGNDFSSYKYNSKEKGYVGNLDFKFLNEMGIPYPDGLVGTMTVKIVDGLPCYIKQEISYGNEKATNDIIYYDFNATVVELPQVS